MSRLVRYGVDMPWHPEKIPSASLGDAHRLATAVNRARKGETALVFQWYSHKHGTHKDLCVEEQIQRHTKLKIISGTKKPNPGKDSAPHTKQFHSKGSTVLRSVK